MRVSAILLIAGLMLSVGESCAVVIARDGQPLATIIVPDAATVTEQFAADELRSYLAQISGAELSVESEGAATDSPHVYLGATLAGQSTRTALGTDEPGAFAIKTVGDNLVLVGASDRATLYAVYDLLEQELGCRWLGPGEIWEEIPELADIQINDTDRVARPAMKYRLLGMTRGGQPGTWGEDTLDWAVKQKINVARAWPTVDLPENVTVRGGFRAWMTPHVLHNVLDPAEYFDEHPEWYALVNGERKRMPKAGTQQICSTNPEVIEMIAQGLGEMFEARPEADFLGLGQGDGTAFCGCENCTALDTGELWPSSRELPVITERWLTFVNAVARKLQQTHPGKSIYTLAYHQTFRPPDPEVIKPEPNVMIQVVNSRPNYVCFIHGFDNPDCPHHVAFREGLDKWVAMTPAGVTIYGYNPHSTFCSTPFPAAGKFVADMNYMNSVGVVGYDGQSVPTLWGTYGINHYALARGMWAGELGAEAIVAEYCDAAFGPASAQMQAFVKTAEEALLAGEHITEGVWSWMTPEAMAQARDDLDAAHAAAEGASEKVKARLRQWEVSFHYGELGAEAWRTAKQAIVDHDAEALQRAIDMGTAAAQYVQDEKELAPHYAGAPGKLTRVYVSSWQRTLDRWKAE